jgi:hypothetical protein
MKRLTILLLLLEIFSCTKVEEITKANRSSVFDFLTSDSISVNNYVLIKADQGVDLLDSSFYIRAMGAFIDSTTHRESKITDLTINGVTIPKNTADSARNYYYSGTNLAQGIALYGSNVKIKIAGSTLADTVTRNVYMPKKVLKLVKNFPNQILLTSNGYTIQWSKDSLTSWNNIVIQVEYIPTLSKLYNPSAPNDVTPLMYIVPDNGSYTIPAGALNVFPNNSYVRISVGRGSMTSAQLPVSHKTVYFYTISSATTSPRLVLAN